MGGGGAGEVQKKYSRKGKLNEKIHARQLILKIYSCYSLKKFLRLENTLIPSDPFSETCDFSGGYSLI